MLPLVPPFIDRKRPQPTPREYLELEWPFRSVPCWGELLGLYSPKLIIHQSGLPLGGAVNLSEAVFFS